MNPIIRNLISVTRRFKLAVVLNILGLSVSFAAFTIIMIQLDYDYRFDRCHKDHDKIFRIEISVPMFAQTNIARLPRMIADAFFTSSPHIVVGALSVPSSIEQVFFHVETATGARNFFREKSLTVSPEFFELFTFDFVEGSANNHSAADGVFIPLSMARKLFGKEAAVGRQITLDDGTTRTVAAVYRDLPSNTIVENRLFFTLPLHRDKFEQAFNYNAFIRVDDASNAPQLIDNFFRNLDFSTFGEGSSREDFEKMGFKMYLTPLIDIHFSPQMQFDYVPKVSKQTLLILLLVALVIIAIAAINFTNFSMALTPMRIKSINTQRVLGARSSTIRLSFVSEAVIVCMLSFLVSLALVLLFSTSPLASLVEADLSLTAYPLIVCGSALVALFTGFLAGIYPSFYVTSMVPALVLRGSFGISPKGKKLRNTLIGIQFSASFTLMIGTIFMYLQNEYMQKSDLGYHTDNIIVVDMERIAGSRDAFANQIKAFSEVEAVSFGGAKLASTDGYGSFNLQYKGKRAVSQLITVDYSFLDVMGIEVTQGRDFRREDVNTEKGVLIFNETARKQYGFELNTQLDGGIGGEIVGFIPDIKFASFRSAVEPMGFYVSGTQFSHFQTNIAYIKLKEGTDMSTALSHIQTTLVGYNANYPFEVHFLDDIIKHLYKKETSLNSLISLFSLLFIIIAIVGVFGLVVFDCEYRRKEIGIRKVLSASILNIIVMFNKTYLKTLMISFVIAAPIAWYAITRWLENFAYKTPMYWWVYLLAFVAVGVITAATVTIQSWRAANDNPLNAIKSE